MKTIFVKNQEFNSLPEPVCAAIGNFDGVHLGHQKLFDECKRHNLKSAVLTFYPHPSVFLKKLIRVYYTRKILFCQLFTLYLDIAIR